MHERSPTDCSHCAQSEVAHPVACFGCQTCQFTCDHYICTKYVAPKLCVKCRGVITTPLLEGDERCVKCADYDPNDPDNGELDA